MNLASYIDHTCLRSNATREDIDQLVEEAHKYGFYSVCINPSRVKQVKEKLASLDNNIVKICTVVGFPLGANTTTSKAFEAMDAVAEGANEIDMVVNIGAIKDNDYAQVEHDIRTVSTSVKDRALVKVIIETHLLTEQEKTLVTESIIKAGAHFVKTSTGFTGGGATVDDILLLNSVSKNRIGIKASGGIKTIDQVHKLIEAGATRIGSSSSVSFMY